MRPPTGPVVAIVGRPNVGKSTLVNRLTGGRDAIVQEHPGITRDRTAHVAEWRGRWFTVVDTGGWTPAWVPERTEIDAAVAAQAELAVLTADLVLLVVDATVGVTEEDSAAARWLRGQDAPTLVVANKVDHGGQEADLPDLYRLGLGDPHAVSALHGRGSGDLLDVVVQRLEAGGAFDRVPVGRAEDDGVPGVALIGRPNVGKSSLFNRLLGVRRTAGIAPHDGVGMTEQLRSQAAPYSAASRTTRSGGTISPRRGDRGRPRERCGRRRP